MAKIQNVSVSMHTIDMKFHIAKNVELFEMKIDVFDELDEQAFVNETIKTAKRFWKKMAATRIKNKMKFRYGDYRNEI